jgi:heme-degrading monooxygenase HmoA
MFARLVTMELKKGVVTEFPRQIEKDILPLLRKQKGFLEELVLTTPNKTEAVAISLWETKEYAEKYNREVYPEVVKLLNKYVEGKPIVKEFEVEFATIPVFEKLVRGITV